MQEKKTNRWQLYLLTLLVAFVIVAIAGIRNAKRRALQIDALTAEKLALQASAARFSDPNTALALLDSAFAFDTTNALVTDKAFDIFFASEYYPPSQTILPAREHGVVGHARDGAIFIVGDDSELIRFALGEPEPVVEQIGKNILAVGIGHQLDHYAYQTENGLHIHHGAQDKTFPEVQAQYLEYSPDGRYLACLSSETVEFIALDSLQTLAWDQSVTMGMLSDSGKLQVAWSRDGGMAAVSLRSASVYVHHFATGQVVELDFAAWLGETAPASIGFSSPDREGTLLWATSLTGNFGALIQGNSVQTIGRVMLSSDQGTYRPGAPVYSAATGQYDVVAELLAEATPALVRTRLGSLVEVTDQYARAIYRPAPGRALRWGTRVAGTGVVAVDNAGQIYSWQEGSGAGPGVVYATDSSTLVQTPPHFTPQGVEFMDHDGRTTVWNLGQGLHSDTTLASSAALAAGGGGESGAWRTGWMVTEDSALVGHPSWQALGSHRDMLLERLEYEALGAVAPVYKLAPDGQSLLIAVRDEYSQRFYNTFLWIPFSTQKVLEIMRLPLE